MIYGSRVPRLRYAFWRAFARLHRWLWNAYVVYIDGEVDSIWRSERQAHKYANLEGGEVNDDTPLYGRMEGRDAIVGAELRNEDRRGVRVESGGEEITNGD